MKNHITSIIAAASLAFGAASWAAEGPQAPSLKELLKRPNTQAIIFRPTSLAEGQSLNLTHIRLGDGSVKPGAAVQLIVFSDTPNEAGEHQVLFQDFHYLSRDGSPVRKFKPFVAPEGDRTGIIAILIGLLQPAEGAPFRPTALPPQDLVAAEITDPTGIALLLPAVQKVRSAAAR